MVGRVRVSDWCWHLGYLLVHGLIMNQLPISSETSMVIPMVVMTKLCQRMRRLPMLLLLFALVGCAHHGAPSFVLFGAYFPAWMLLALMGILVAIGARIVFVGSGLASIVPHQLFVCAAIGLVFAILAWLLWFGP